MRWLNVDFGVRSVQFDLFLGVPKHRVPSVVVDGGMAENGWIPVNPRTLETKYPGIYAVGDGANTGTPKAGVFAEGAALAVASALIAKLRNGGKAMEYSGFGTCYVEFGGGRIGKGRGGFLLRSVADGKVLRAVDRFAR
jgi:sulfide:quinone oxidoreductase